MLYRLMPRKVRLFSAAGERFVTIDALEPGHDGVLRGLRKFFSRGLDVRLGHPLA